MENPATWGKAERVVNEVLTSFFNNQAKVVNDPTTTLFGLSLESQITTALRNAGLLSRGDNE